MLRDAVLYRAVSEDSLNLSLRPRPLKCYIISPSVANILACQRGPHHSDLFLPTVGFKKDSCCSLSFFIS